MFKGKDGGEKILKRLFKIIFLLDGLITAHAAVWAQP